MRGGLEGRKKRAKAQALFPLELWFELGHLVGRQLLHNRIVFAHFTHKTATGNDERRSANEFALYCVVMHSFEFKVSMVIKRLENKIKKGR